MHPLVRASPPVDSTVFPMKLLELHSPWATNRDRARHGLWHLVQFVAISIAECCNEAHLIGTRYHPLPEE